jgi:ADP-heptose:LPS heptosyltransferase
MGNNKTYRMSGFSRVAILRALNLGDLLCAVPAFRALRTALPNAQITLIGLPWAKSFVDRFSTYLDDFLEFPGFPGLPERTPELKKIPLFIQEAQWLNFDLALQMQGSGAVTNPLAALLGARKTAGFYLPGQYCPNENSFIPYPVHLSEIRTHLSLMEHLGFASSGEHLEFPLFVEDWEEYHALVQEYNLEPGKFVVVHPGARSPQRRWRAENFALVADGLSNRGFKVVLTGTDSEGHLTSAVAGRMQNSSALDLTGKTSLGSLGVLLSKSRMLISNDTGVSHLAAALKIPSVILFMASDPQRWAPEDKELHRAVAWASATSPEVVLDEVDILLSKERLYAF